MDKEMTETEQKLLAALRFANDELTKARIIEVEQNALIRKLQGEIAQLKGLDK
jgi:hypothetical protein